LELKLAFFVFDCRPLSVSGEIDEDEEANTALIMAEEGTEEVRAEVNKTFESKWFIQERKPQ